jgi:hypothetical protein
MLALDESGAKGVFLFHYWLWRGGLPLPVGLILQITGNELIVHFSIRVCGCTNRFQLHSWEKILA